MMTLQSFTQRALAAATLLFCVNTLRADDPVTTTISVPKTVLVAATQVNDSGVTAGTYLDNKNVTGAFVEDSGEPQKFTVPWGTNPVPTSINNSNEIVGYYIVATNVVRGFLRRPGGKLVQINPQGAVTSCPRVVTDSGVVAGVFSVGNNKGHGFIMTGNQFTLVDYPGAATTTLTDMNNDGAAVGVWIRNQQTHGLLRSPQGAFTSIDFPGSTSTQAIKIDARGNILGFYKNAGGRAFGFRRKTDGSFEKIAPPRAVSGNTVAFINGEGVVGMSSIDSAPGSPSVQGVTPYLLEGTGQYHSVDVNGASTTFVKGGSSNGWIAGAYVDKKNSVHAFKLKLVN